MVTMAQRIEALRNEKGLSRPALAAELGFPKNAIEKYETGRATPTKDQQEKMASYFGVSLFYLRGESSDKTKMEDWMDGAFLDAPAGDSRPAPRRPPKPEAAPPAPGAGRPTGSGPDRETAHTNGRRRGHSYPSGNRDIQT